MAKKAKVKGPESVGFKEIFGVTTLATNNGFAVIFMSTMFMTYMTDYAGLGAWGATLATTLLLAVEDFDWMVLEDYTAYGSSYQSTGGYFYYTNCTFCLIFLLLLLIRRRRWNIV